MKQFFEIVNSRPNAEDFIKEGYRVISFGAVKKELTAILKDENTFDRYHKYNYPFDKGQPDLDLINKELNKIVFKESRGGKNFYSVGWENGNSYLRYHSGIGYRWFK